MKKLVICLSMMVAVLSSSCTDHPNEPAEAARVTTAAQVMQELEYHWFYLSYTEYEPESADTLQMFLDVFDPVQDTAVIFMTPDCPCSIDQHAAPKMVKLLNLAGIDPSAVEVLVMDKVDVSHQYQDRIDITVNPTICVFRNGETIVIPVAGDDTCLEASLWRKLKP